MLGDNIFYGHDLCSSCVAQRKRRKAQRYLPTPCRIPSVMEWWILMPTAGFPRLRKSPPSKVHYAVTGLYFYDNEVVEIASQLEAFRPRANWKSPT